MRGTHLSLLVITFVCFAVLPVLAQLPPCAVSILQFGQRQSLMHHSNYVLGRQYSIRPSVRLMTRHVYVHRHPSMRRYKAV